MITSGKLKILRDKSKSPNKKQSNSKRDLQDKDKASSIVQLEENNKVIFAQLQSSEEEILNLSKKASNSEKSWTELKKHNEQLTAQPERSVTETSAIDYRKYLKKEFDVLAIRARSTSTRSRDPYLHSKNVKIRVAA